MALTVRTNIASLGAINQLNRTQGSLTSSLERISSGLRVNRASDDAAGLSVASRMMSDNTSLSQAMRNTNDGISMIQTAEGGLNELNNILVRMRELSVQASNETYNTTDRSMITTEMTQLGAEYTRITDTSNFNRTTLLNSADTSFDIQVGIQNSTNDRISLDLNSLASEAADVGLATLMGGGAAGGIASSGLIAVAQANITIIDSALDDISTRRSRLGAFQNRLESAFSEAANYSQNLSAAQSQIMDVDYASESANMTRYQIQQQAGVAALAQAKAIPHSVISLLS
jgi:flagellin